MTTENLQFIKETFTESYYNEFINSAKYFVMFKGYLNNKKKISKIKLILKSDVVHYGTFSECLTFYKTLLNDFEFIDNTEIKNYFIVKNPY